MNKRMCLLFVGLFLLGSCTKSSDFFVEEVPLLQRSSIAVTAFQCFSQNDPFCDTQVPVIGANVYVYPSKQARMFNDSLINSCTTGGDGKCNIGNLKNPEHFLLVKAPGREDQQIDQTTPAGTTSFLQVIFEN